MGMAMAVGTAGGCQSSDAVVSETTTTTYVRPSPAEREAVLDALADAEQDLTTDATEACVAAGAAALWVMSPTTQWARNPEGADPEAWNAQEAALLEDVPADL